MKIVSQFKDYYDYALAWQTEENDWAYNREEFYGNMGGIISNIEQSFRILNQDPCMYYDCNIWGVHLIFFCGELHVCMRCNMPYEKDTSGKYIYNNNILPFLKEVQKKGRKNSTKHFENDYYFEEILANMVYILDTVHYHFEHLYQLNYTPVFIIDVLGLKCNPRLMDYKFQQIKEPYQAFQDISQFLFGKLIAPEKPMIEVSNATKIEKHGFDKKISFRKRKE